MGTIQSIERPVMTSSSPPRYSTRVHTGLLASSHSTLIRCRHRGGGLPHVPASRCDGPRPDGVDPHYPCVILGPGGRGDMTRDRPATRRERRRHVLVATVAPLLFFGTLGTLAGPTGPAGATTSATAVVGDSGYLPVRGGARQRRLLASVDDCQAVGMHVQGAPASSAPWTGEPNGRASRSRWVPGASPRHVVASATVCEAVGGIEVIGTTDGGTVLDIADNARVGQPPRDRLLCNTHDLRGGRRRSR